MSETRKRAKYTLEFKIEAVNGQFSADDNNEQLRFNFDDGDFRARLLSPSNEDADFVRGRVLVV